jgi:hypothetical protein
MRMIIIYFSRLYKLDEHGSHFENLKNFIKFLNENDYRLHFAKFVKFVKCNALRSLGNQTVANDYRYENDYHLQSKG